MRAARAGGVRAGAVACFVLLGVISLGGPARGKTAGDGEQVRLLDRIRSAPLEAEGFADLARWFLGRNDVERARAAVEEAARLDPGGARYHRLAGYVYAAGGAAREAEAAFRRAADLDPAMRVSLADFRLAQAWAEYQRALRSGPPEPTLEERIRALGAIGEIAPELKSLMHAARPRDTARPAELVPPIYLGPEVANAIVVEKRTQTLRLYERRGNNLALAEVYPCSTGRVTGAKLREGDLRTPSGVYVITDVLPRDQLPQRYGEFALPLSYPNAWDELAGRAGYGIWLHGSNRLGSPFTPRDTKGCVRLRNEDLLKLVQLVSPEITPVVVAEGVRYRPVAEWKATVQGLLARGPAREVLAVAAGPEYMVVIYRRRGEIRQDFLVSDGTAWRTVATEHFARVSPREWREKVAQVLPKAKTRLVRVQVLDRGQPPQVVIETTAPAEVREFQPDFGRRLYLDLLGVRLPPVPAVTPGHGPWVKQVRVAPARLDPPSARVVIDLLQPMTYRLAADGNRLVVSLLAK